MKKGKHPDLKLATQIALAQGLEVEAALTALFVSHPEPARLLEAYGRLAKQQKEYEQLYSSMISDEAWDYVGRMRERLLAALQNALKRAI